MDEVKKRPGRKPLPPELKKKNGISARKEGGYEAQRRYKERHREELLAKQRIKRVNFYEVDVLMPAANKEIVRRLCKEHGVTTSELFLRAFQEKYGIDLRVAHASDNEAGDVTTKD